MLPLILAALPPILLTILLCKYYVGIPFADEWELVPLIEKSILGKLTVHDLWLQHNEHRTFFPQLIMVGLARLTSWNIAYEVALNVILAAGTFAVICWQAARVQSFLGERTFRWLVCAVSVMVFSIRQWENWVMGINMVIFLSVFCSLAGIVTLSTLRFRWRNFTAAAALGVLATYSFSSGLVFWPVALLLLSYSVFQDRQQKRRALMLWTLLAFFTIGIYFYHYVKPSYHPSMFYGIQHPGEFLSYVFIYLGSLLARVFTRDLDGFMAVLFFLGMSRFLFRDRQIKREWFLGFFAMGLFSIGNAIITAIGRAGFHPLQATGSRYVTISYPFWVSNLFLGALTIKAILGRTNDLNGGKRILRWVGVSLYAFVMCLAVSLSVFSIALLQRHNKLRNVVRQELFSPKDDSLLKEIYPDPAIVKERTKILRQHKLCIFRTD